MLSVWMLLSVPTSEVLWCYHSFQLLQTSYRRQWKVAARSHPIIDFGFKSPNFKTTPSILSRPWTLF
jgi:hypothetical protein